MFSSIGTVEWVVIALVVLLLVGGKRIPELVRGASKAIKEVKKASSSSGEEASAS